jgi:hypothetical protein
VEHALRILALSRRDRYRHWFLPLFADVDLGEIFRRPAAHRDERVDNAARTRDDFLYPPDTGLPFGKKLSGSCV